MPREKFQTLTEQMFYILLCLQTECCGMDVMARVNELTGGRVAVGPGTLYTILGKLTDEQMIRETAVEGRKRTYTITEAGQRLYDGELARLRRCVRDADREEDTPC